MCDTNTVCLSVIPGYLHVPAMSSAPFTVRAVATYRIKNLQ